MHLISNSIFGKLERFIRKRRLYGDMQNISLWRYLKKNSNSFSVRGDMITRYSALFHAFISSYEKECLMLCSLVLFTCPIQASTFIHAPTISHILLVTEEYFETFSAQYPVFCSFPVSITFYLVSHLSQPVISYLITLSFL